MMNPEKAKRNQAIKVWIIDGLMALAVVVLVAVLTLVVFGYRLNGEGGLEQTGLLQLKSLPTGATVQIDGEDLHATTNTNQTLAEGTYQVNLAKNGYLGWEKSVRVEAGLLTQIDYARLFKEERVMETVRKLPELEFLAAGPERDVLIYADAGAKVWRQMSIRRDEVEVKRIDLAEVLDFEVGAVEILEWNAAETRVLAQVGEVKGKFATHFILVNLENPAESVDLTTQFNLEFKQVRMEDAADKLLVLTGTELHELDLGRVNYSEVLLENVAEFSSNGINVAYITTERDGEYEVGTYRVGERAGQVARAVDGEVKVLVSAYKGQNYLTISDNCDIIVYRGEFNGQKDLKLVFEGKMDAAAEILTTNANGAYIVAAAGEKRGVYDVEMKEFYRYAAGGTGVQWLDRYILYTVEDGTLVARDFDGGNARRLMRAETGYGAVISSDNHWIYYYAEGELRRERI